MKATRTVSKPLIASATLVALLSAALPGLAADEKGTSTPPATTTKMPAAQDTTTPPAKEVIAPSEKEEKTTADPMFKRLDANRDGYVSLEEAGKQPKFTDAFKQSDEDRDGKLSPSEFIKAHALYDRQRVSAYASDSLITAKVKAALIKDPIVSALDVSVETAYGEVLLSGFVQDKKQADRAREIASRVDGVTEVHVNLIVEG